MKRNPSTMNTAAIILKGPKSLPRKTKSASALIGIPNTVPKEINKGYVRAIPKLSRKLKMSARNPVPQRNSHGMSPQSISSYLVKWKTTMIGHKINKSRTPRQDRKRETWDPVAFPTTLLNNTWNKHESTIIIMNCHLVEMGKKVACCCCCMG